RRATQKGSVLIEPHVVGSFRTLTFLSHWILHAGRILVLPCHPQEFNVALRSGRGHGASELARSARHALTRQTLLRPSQRALNAVPDLPGGTGQGRGRGVCWRA